MAKEMYISLRCECYDCIRFDCEKQLTENVTGLNSDDAMASAVRKGWIVFKKYETERYYAPGHIPPPIVRRILNRKGK